MSNWIVTADLHLTDAPEDEYRWGVFEFLIDKANELGKGSNTLFVLGDLTDKKDYHSAKLVNRVVNSFVSLYRNSTIKEIIILRGNHDGVDGGVAYFEFMNAIPYVHVITKPELRNMDFRKIALLPHTKDPAQDWALIEFGEAKYVFMHQTVTGAVGESGRVLEGTQNIASLLGGTPAKVFSGDIHAPQRIGNIEYVGSPYHIHFGDDYQGRILCAQAAKILEWHYPTIRKIKITIRDAKELAKYDLEEGDQIKVELALHEEERHEWHIKKEAIEKWCIAHKVNLCGVELKGRTTLKLKSQRTEKLTPDTAFDKYCEKTEVREKTKNVGKGLLLKARKP